MKHLPELENIRCLMSEENYFEIVASILDTEEGSIAQDQPWPTEEDTALPPITEEEAAAEAPTPTLLGCLGTGKEWWLPMSGFVAGQVHGAPALLLDNNFDQIPWGG